MNSNYSVDKLTRRLPNWCPLFCCIVLSVLLSACQSTKVAGKAPPVESKVVLLLNESAVSPFAFSTNLLNGISEQAIELIESQMLAESLTLLPATFEVLNNTLLLPPLHYLNAESALQLYCETYQQCMFSYNKSGKLFTSLLLANQDSNAENSTLNKERQIYINMAEKGLEILYKKNPKVRAEIESAAGYGVFEVDNFNIVLYVAAYGRGLIVDNRDHRPTYMYVVRSGTGPGLGFQKTYAIFVFKNRFALNQFIGAKDVGGDIGASATLGWVGLQVSFNPLVDVYLVNQYGFDIQANWGATLYFITPGLN